jgi:hypothetical protein
MDRREALKKAAWVMGGTLSAPAILGVLNGCAAKPTIDWIPSFFTEDQGILISQVAGIIIPKTDTDGAIEVGVPGFIDQLVGETYKKEDQESFIKELEEFALAASDKYGDPFIDLDPEKQTEWVYAQHQKAVQDDKSWRPFILKLKELTMLGYFTSEVGATQVLRYDPVPGAYHGCIPFEEVGKTWAI